MLNVRFIIKMLGMMFILETFFMLAATAVALFYKENDFYPLLQSSGILFGTGVLFTLIGVKANEYKSILEGLADKLPLAEKLCISLSKADFSLPKA